MRPSRDSVLMQMAELAAMRSTCSRQSVGVILAREGRVLSTGYNGAPAGMPHCSHECTCSESYRNNLRTAISRGRNIPPEHQSTCPAGKACEVSVHAECNAIAFAAKHGVSTEAATLYTTHSPCLACAQLVINSGISRVVWWREHRDRRGLDLLQQSVLVRLDCLESEDLIG